LNNRKAQKAGTSWRTSRELTQIRSEPKNTLSPESNGIARMSCQTHVLKFSYSSIAVDISCRQRPFGEQTCIFKTRSKTFSTLSPGARFTCLYKCSLWTPLKGN